MVLGCIICREPLVTYVNLTKKKRYLKGQLRKEENEEEEEEPRSEIKENQLVLSKCGHIFHKSCLKGYVTYSLNGGSAKRECPFCFKQVVFGQCINVFMNVETKNALVEKIRGINNENDEIHVRITNLKTDLAKKTLFLTEVTENITSAKTAKQAVLNHSDFNQIKDPQEAKRTIKELVEGKEKLVKYLMDQNSKLISLIQKQATYFQSLPEKENVKGNLLFQSKPTLDFTRVNKYQSNYSGMPRSASSICEEYQTIKEPLDQNSYLNIVFMRNKNHKETENIQDLVTSEQAEIKKEDKNHRRHRRQKC